MGVAILLWAALFMGKTCPISAANASSHPLKAASGRPQKSTQSLINVSSRLDNKERYTPKDSVIWNNDTLSINEAAVITHFGDTKRSPLRLTTIDQDAIKQKAVTKSYPEMLQSIPGLYGTSENGSFGDAKVNIRGFKQENISILLNGIPISGQTSGNMYWNNWMGLADATYAIQVQKGIGSSMLSDNSVGGTINIITSRATERFYFEAGVYGTHYGSGKGYISINSGTLPKGWSINFMGSYLGGKGYVDQTNVSTFSYMLNIHKNLGLNNSLTFTALGSPEKHGQRNSRLSAEETEKHGLHYNKDWGLLRGKPYNLSQNNYYKPYFTLHHKYSKDNWSMQNSLYLAIAHGGGRWNEAKTGRMNNIIGPDGQIDFEKIIQTNQDIISSGATGKDGGAQYILSDFMAGHTQVGAIISAAVKLNRWKVEFGTHYQHYATWEKEKITDLLGGKYWWESENKSNQTCMKKEGDYIRTNNGKITDRFTLYAQASYELPKWNIDLGISGMGAINRRWDKFNYRKNDIWSKNVGGAGFSSKAGVMYRPSNGHNIYANGGLYNRLPYSNAYFSSGNNEITPNIENEWNYLTELGYRFTSTRVGVELTGYWSLWTNKTLMSNKYKQSSGDDKKFMINGLDAMHYGVEIDAFWRPAWWVKLSGYASIGNWTWQNNVKANIYDEYNGKLIQEINVYTKGLHVGDAPQTQVGAGAEFKILKDFIFKLDWNFNDRMYADFDPSTRTDEQDKNEAWMLPSWHMLNAHLSWTHSFKRKYLISIFVDGNNLLNSKYIERGKDGKGHNAEDFRGFWGFGTNCSFGLRFRFH